MLPTQYMLDLLVKEGEFSPGNSSVDGVLWFVISCDGINQPFSTNQTTSSQKLVWNFPSRVFLQLYDIQRAYMYITLCTYGPNGQGVVAIARSKIALRLLPPGNAKKFTFPLMDASNSAKEVMQLKLLASISVLKPTYSVDNSKPFNSAPQIGSVGFMNSTVFQTHP